MKAFSAFQLALSLILVVPVVVKAQPSQLTPFLSKEITVATMTSCIGGLFLA